MLTVTELLWPFAKRSYKIASPHEIALIFFKSWIQACRYGFFSWPAVLLVSHHGWAHRKNVGFL